MSDLLLVETADGGDLVLKGNDLVSIEGFQNMPYLALFGGNVEASTEGLAPTNDENFDWWGNNLLMPNDSRIQMNSTVEKLLQNIALTSSTRIEIEQAVISDLSFMKVFATVKVLVSLVGVDRVEINIFIQELAGGQSTLYAYIWNATDQELTIVPDPGVTLPGGAFSDGFSNGFKI